MNGPSRTLAAARRLLGEGVRQERLRAHLGALGVPPEQQNQASQAADAIAHYWGLPAGEAEQIVAIVLAAVRA